MAPSARVAVTAAVLVALVVAAPAAVGALQCGQVAVFLAPCVGYATGRVAALPSGCCTGVRTLNSAAATPADRKAACGCLKQQAGSVPNIRPDLITGIPSKCGVNIPYPISASTDCSKVH